jgi:hypothetical protein
MGFMAALWAQFSSVRRRLSAGTSMRAA